VAYESSIDVEQLLSPIPGESPVGANLMYVGLHDQIREARRADETLAQGDWKYDLKTANWHQVVALTTDALGSKTKDLQVAAWLAEALTNLHGFSGLHDGLRLMRGLMDRFWDTLYPEIDEGDLEARANAIDVFNRPFFLAALQKIPITGNPIGVNYGHGEYKDSSRFDIPEGLEDLPIEERERFVALKQTAATEGKITSVQWRAVKAATNRAFYEDLNSLLGACWEDCKALDALMDEKLQRQTPGLSDFKKTLEAIRSTVETIVKEKRILEPDPVDVQDSAAGAETPGGEPGRGPASGAIVGRREALRRLAEVAEFFRSTEPHSPVSYLLERAIRWGQIPLKSWLDEVVKDQSVLAQIRETLGLRPGE
jgi:type VI secretion system protein ImpA